MSAVWRASRAAVSRRHLQTFVIGLVVFASTVTLIVALGLLAAVSAPFDKAFDQQRGPHAVVTFDAAAATGDQLAQTARRPGVAAAAGPFGEAVVDVPEDFLWRPAGPLTVVGRADPGGPVDHLKLVSGHWATGPGEIVVNWPIGGAGGPDLLGTTITATGVPPLTVVGFATSMSGTADAWVTPAQVAALHPTATVMLYRFTEAGSDAQVAAGLAKATAGLPAGSTEAVQSYLTLKRAFSAQADAFLSFIAVFSLLGLLVSVLIVGNVVSGAVVSGHRHIGVLKALGYTPNQVVAVYLVMMSVPAVVGAVLGVGAGTALLPVILKIAFSGIHTGTAVVGVSAWVPVAGLLGMLALVVVTALLPALRAHRLSAAEAISAGSAPRAGRGLRVQRLLGGSRLPRPISLGLGQPFARPARSLMTLAAILLGVTTVTLATGLASTMVAYGQSGRSTDHATVEVHVGSVEGHETVPRLSAAQIDALLRSLPGADRLTARGLLQVSLIGQTQPVFVDFYRGDTSELASEIFAGRLPGGPGEVAAGPGFLTKHGLAVGDRVTLVLNGRQVPSRIVGELIAGSDQAISATWATLTRLAPATRAVDYTVLLKPGADGPAYVAAVKAADPGLYPSVRDGTNVATATVVSFSTVFTVLLAIVAALGVFNTVLLTVRERRRDLGMLKSIGMTPRQVVLMTVASVAGLGVLAGLLGIPLGILAHRLIVDHIGIIAFPESMKDVWQVPRLVALALAGVAIAVLGALIPARSAARLTIARVLHNE